MVPHDGRRLPWEEHTETVWGDDHIPCLDMCADGLGTCVYQSSTGAPGELSQLSIRLDFGSGHDMRVLTLSPKGDSTVTAQSLLGILSLPLSLCPSPAHVRTCSLCLSLSLKKKKKKVNLLSVLL